jgi:regulatory protein RepA
MNITEMQKHPAHKEVIHETREEHDLPPEPPVPNSQADVVTTAPDAEKGENPKAALLAKNPRVSLLSLKTPVYGDDPTELIQHRFLYRGGICVFSSLTGQGKSSFSMGWGISLAAGDDFFSMRIGHCYRGEGLRVIFIQAENDEADMAEQRDGATSVFSQETLQAADKNLSFVQMPDAASGEFIARLDAHIEDFQADVVFIDPVLSFLGGDNGAQKDVSLFLRNMLLPVLIKHGCAAIIIHHYNKPNKDRPEMGAYSMSGAAEWANAARCCIALEPMAESVFKIVATKRGKRLGWRDADDYITTVQHIAHHGGEDENGNPIIAWRYATEDEIQSATATKGRPSKVSEADIVEALREKHPAALKQKDIVKKLGEKLGVSDKPVRDAIKAAESADKPKITSMALGRCKLYSLATGV